MAPKTKENETQEEETTQAVRPADLASDLEVSAKALRGFLRREFPRPNDAKNTSWTLTPEMVEAATAHFTPSEDEDEGNE